MHRLRDMTDKDQSILIHLDKNAVDMRNQTRDQIKNLFDLRISNRILFKRAVLRYMGYLRELELETENAVKTGHGLDKAIEHLRLERRSLFDTAGENPYKGDGLALPFPFLREIDPDGEGERDSALAIGGGYGTWNRPRSIGGGRTDG